MLLVIVVIAGQIQLLIAPGKGQSSSSTGSKRARDGWTDRRLGLVRENGVPVGQSLLCIQLDLVPLSAANRSATVQNTSATRTFRNIWSRQSSSYKRMMMLDEPCARRCVCLYIFIMIHPGVSFTRRGSLRLYLSESFVLRSKPDWNRRRWWETNSFFAFSYLFLWLSISGLMSFTWPGQA